MQLPEKISGHKLHDSIYVTFSKWQNYRDGATSVAKGISSTREMGQFCVIPPVVVTCTYMWYNCTEVYTHIHTCTWGEIWVRSMDYTNVNFLALILYYSYVRCYPQKMLREGGTQDHSSAILVLSFTTSCASHRFKIG